MGLDLIDDARAVALVDWNFDGAIDIWVANRTAPRVRLLRNPNGSGNHWLAIKLQGVTCNRDAIGARLELYYSGDSSPALIKTLHAGDGYLAQSSKWIHFGLGTRTAIERLDVVWPGGKRERFEGLIADRHYQLIEGMGHGQEWNVPGSRLALAARPIELPTDSPGSRTWIMGRVPLPADQYLDANGQIASISQYRGRPVLVNLWSRNCQPCIDELAEWSVDERLGQASSFNVLALCVDSIDGDAESLKTARAFLRKAGISFQVGLPTTELLDAMEVVQRTFLEFQQPLPIPCSFLIDPFGRVTAIYKGRSSAEQIKQDLRLLNRPRVEQRDAAVPFSGRWASQLFPFNPIPVARTLELAGRDSAALSYLQDYVQLIEKELPPHIRAAEQHDEVLIDCYRTLGERLLGDNRKQEAFTAFERLRELAANRPTLQRQIGNLLLSRGLARRALSHYELALTTTPDDAQLRYHMGLAALSARNVSAAIKHLRASIEIQPHRAATHFHLANALQMVGETTDAVKHYRLTLKEAPESPIAANNLAWILATNPNPEIRDGTEAVRWAESCCRATGYNDASTLATLAAAYAEFGDFDKAVQTNGRAIELLEQAGGQDSELNKLKQRQVLFDSEQPFRQ